MRYDTLIKAAESSGETPPEGEKINYGGVHIRKFVFAKGTILASHCHVYDHPSILAAGTVNVWTQKTGMTRYTAPAEVLIPADCKHAVECLTDAVWYCIHAQEPVVLDQGSL